MKKLLLTSAGFQNPETADEFLKLADKTPSEIKVIFIPTASSRTEEELKHVIESKKELADIDIRKENIKTLDLNHRISYDEVVGFDAIYVCGENTFYLLQKVREACLDKIIKKFVEDGGTYVQTNKQY